MNITNNLLFNFYDKNKFIIILIILLSFIINIIQINILSYITATIIKSIQSNNKSIVYLNYKYFISASILYIIVYNSYKYFQNNMMVKFKGWCKTTLMEIIFSINDENYSNKNFTTFSPLIQRCVFIFYNILNNFISVLLPNIILIIIIFLYFFINNYTFGLIFLIGNICIILYLYFNWNTMTKLHKKYENDYVNNDNIILDFLNNFEKIIYRNESKTENDFFNVSVEKSIKSGNIFFNSILKNSFIINLLVFVLIILLLYYLIYLYFSKKINITIFITFLTILLLYRDRILTNVNQLPEYLEYFGRENNLFKYLDENKFEKKIKKKHNLKFDNIKFNNIYFSHNQNNIFENLNINIDTNKIIGVTGLSGNGKSTFVKLLIKMYKYDGEILIDNVNINDIDNKYIRKNIIYISQNSKLFDKSVKDNIFYGCKDKISNDYLVEIFKFKKIKKLFENIDFEKQVGLNGEKLSGGQRQVINLINGMIIPCKILIIDEPTNALDIELKRDVIEMIKYFKKYIKCIIIISHDKDIFTIFDEKINL